MKNPKEKNEFEKLAEQDAAEKAKADAQAKENNARTGDSSVADGSERTHTGASARTTPLGFEGGENPNPDLTPNPPDPAESPADAPAADGRPLESQPLSKKEGYSK